MRLLATTLLALLLAACTPSPADIPASAAPEGAASYESLSGFISESSGVFRLRTADGSETLLTPATPAVSLSTISGSLARVEGAVTMRADGHREMRVTAVSLAETGSIISPAVTQNTQTDFVSRKNRYLLTLPAGITAEESTTGSIFSRLGTEFMRIVVMENPEKLPLLDFLKQKYGFTDAQLQPITVGSFSGYQFINETGRVIYLDAVDRVYAFVLTDTSDATKAESEKRFLDILRSFRTSGPLPERELTLVGFGQICGITTRCASGLTCKKEQGSQAGVCSVDPAAASTTAIPATATPINETLTPLTPAELARGWYYGDIQGKRPGTPDDWELIDSGTNLALWRKASGAEYTATLEKANILFNQLSKERQRVTRELVSSISLVAPEPPKTGAWKVIHLSFVEPRYVYITYASGNQMRRVLAEYAFKDELSAPTITLHAYGKPKQDGTWTVMEGIDIAQNKALTVLELPNGEIIEDTSSTSRITYRSTTWHFTLVYQDGWYWRQATSDRAEFSDRPFPKGKVRIAVEVINGADYDFEKALLHSEQFILYVPYNKERSIRIMGSRDYADIIRAMAKSIKL